MFSLKNRKVYLHQIAACAVVAASLCFGLSDIRIFPFSNFPIFPYVKNRPDIVGLEYVDAKGSHLVPNEYFLPLTRLQFRQQYASIMRSRRNPAEAINAIRDRLLRLPDIKSVRIVSFEIEPLPDETSPYRILKRTILHEIPL